MEEDGGVYKVPCVVNGAKMKFIFDTGASTVCLSESMAEYLLDNDYISKEDITGVGTSIVADGSEVEHLKIILKDIEIGGLHLENVEACIIKGQRAPLLLGQTAIKQLGEISIDENRLCIKTGKSTMSDIYAQKKLEEAIILFYEKKNYVEVIEILSDLEKNNRTYCEQNLGEFGFIYIYVISLSMMERDLECIQVLERYQNLNTSYQKGDSIIEVQGWDTWDSFMNIENGFAKGILSEKAAGSMAHIYEQLLSLYKFYALSLKSVNRYRESIKYFNRCDIILNSTTFNRSKGDDEIIQCRDRLISCYIEVNDLYVAKELCEKSITERCQFLNITKQDVQSNKVHDEILGRCYYCYAYIMYKIEKKYSYEKADNLFDTYSILAAKCGHEGSIEYCKKNNLSYLGGSNSMFY